MNTLFHRTPLVAASVWHFVIMSFAMNHSVVHYFNPFKIKRHWIDKHSGKHQISLITSRSSRPEMFCEKAVLRNVHTKTPVRESLVGLTPFLKEHLRWLLLNLCTIPRLSSWGKPFIKWKFAKIITNRVPKVSYFLLFALFYFCYLFLFFSCIEKQSLNKNYQEQQSRGVLGRRCSENMLQTYRKTPITKCDFNKITKQLQHGCSPVNFLHIFGTSFFSKNTSGRLLLTSPSDLNFYQKINSQIPNFGCLLDNFAIFTGKHLYWSLFFYKTADLWNVRLNNCFNCRINNRN